MASKKKTTTKKTRTQTETKKKNKGIFSKIIVSAVIILNVLFTYAILKVFLKTSCEPTSLVVAWFSFTTVELWSLAGIKKAKEKKKNNYNED
jgi:uncharacterized protein with PQ loop repeat